MSIPLVQDNEKDSINTSIIAIKRNIERINMLLGLVDNDSPDLSGFATKQELQDAVTDLQPVDEVTVGNMQSVTSNAVAEKIAPLERQETVAINWTIGTFKGITYKQNNIIYIQGTLTLTSGVAGYTTELGNIYETEFVANAPLFSCITSSGAVVYLYSSGYGVVTPQNI